MLKHIETSWSFIKGSLLQNQAQNTYHLSHSFSTSITNLLTGSSRYGRAISVVPDVPCMCLTLLTNPFISIHCNYFCHRPTISFCCFLEQDNIHPFVVYPNGVPFLLTLKFYKDFFSLSTPKLIRDVLHSSPMFTTINAWCIKNSRGWHHYSWLQC